jgi:hypothetical protein
VELALSNSQQHHKQQDVRKKALQRDFGDFLVMIGNSEKKNVEGLQTKRFEPNT